MAIQTAKAEGLKAIDETPVAKDPTIGAKRTRVFIDQDGNEVKPFTREVVTPAEKPYQPTREEMESAAARKPPTAEENAAALAEIKAGVPAVASASANFEMMIQKKIEAMVEKKIEDVLKKMLS